MRFDLSPSLRNCVTSEKLHCIIVCVKGPFAALGHVPCLSLATLFSYTVPSSSVAVSPLPSVHVLRSVPNPHSGNFPSSSGVFLSWCMHGSLLLSLSCYLPHLTVFFSLWSIITTLNKSCESHFEGPASTVTACRSMGTEASLRSHV